MVTNSNISGDDGDNRRMVIEVLAVWLLTAVEGADQYGPAGDALLVLVVVVGVIVFVLLPPRECSAEEELS